MDTLPPDEWISRCAQRIGEIDGDIPEDEAYDIARELQSFERTAVMPPELAVDFVASELATGRPGRFERRLVPRT